MHSNLNAAGGKPTTRLQACNLSRLDEWNDIAAKMTLEEKATALARTQIPFWAERHTDEQKFAHFGCVPFGVGSHLFLPKWAQRDTVLEFETIASADDMLSTMNIFYVRAGNFWSAGNFSLVPELHQAKPFFSKEAAQDHAKQFDHYPSLAIVQASMIVTAVEFMPDTLRTDPISNRLHSACESRDLAAAIDSLAADRLAANPETPSAAPKRRL